MPSLVRIIINPAKPTHTHNHHTMNPNERMGSEKRVLFIAFFLCFFDSLHAFFCWKFDLQPTFKNKKQHIDYITHATMCVRVFKCSFLILFFFILIYSAFHYSIFSFFLLLFFVWSLHRIRVFYYFLASSSDGLSCYAFFFCACRWII